jgi:hypothetical protein
MRNLRVIAFVILAIMSPLAASGTASAASVNYGSQTTASVTVFYFGLPASTQLYFRNQVNGAEIAAASPLVSGTGSVTLSFNVLPVGPGQYYILARTAGAWTAESVLFYLFI